MANPADYIKPGASKYKLSTAYKFVANGADGQRIVFGGAQSLTFRHNKTLSPHAELNTSAKLVEITPGLTNAITITVQGLALSTTTMMSQFSGVSDIQGLYDQSLPFDIEVFQTIQKINSDGSIDPKVSSSTVKLLKTYTGCLFQDWTETVQITGDIVVTENATILALDVK